MDANQAQNALRQIRMEYLEMPDLKLTVQQARRLFALPVELCEPALEALALAGFLSRTRDGAFFRPSGTAVRVI
jgi:hypothetical protein